MRPFCNGRIGCRMAAHAGASRSTGVKQPTERNICFIGNCEKERNPFLDPSPLQSPGDAQNRPGRTLAKAAKDRRDPDQKLDLSPARYARPIRIASYLKTKAPRMPGASGVLNFAGQPYTETAGYFLAFAARLAFLAALSAFSSPPPGVGTLVLGNHWANSFLSDA